MGHTNDRKSMDENIEKSVASYCMQVEFCLMWFFSITSINTNLRLCSGVDPPMWVAKIEEKLSERSGLCVYHLSFTRKVRREANITTGNGSIFLALVLVHNVATLLLLVFDSYFVLLNYLKYLVKLVKDVSLQVAWNLLPRFYIVRSYVFGEQLDDI